NRAGCAVEIGDDARDRRAPLLVISRGVACALRAFEGALLRAGFFEVCARGMFVVRGRWAELQRAFFGVEERLALLNGGARLGDLPHVVALLEVGYLGDQLPHVEGITDPHVPLFNASSGAGAESPRGVLGD